MTSSLDLMVAFEKRCWRPSNISGVMISRTTVSSSWMEEDVLFFGEVEVDPRREWALSNFFSDGACMSDGLMC